jgi:hypothetical protein
MHAPYFVGVTLTSEEIETRPGQNPLWAEIARLSALEAPIFLWLDAELTRDQPQAQGSRETFLEAARGGQLHVRLKRWLKETTTLTDLAYVISDLTVETLLVELNLGFHEAAEVAIPLDSALHGPIESARAARRRHALLGVTSGSHREAEAARTLHKAITRDRALAIPAYRSALVERLEAALRECASPPAGDRLHLDARRRRVSALTAALLATEVLPPARNFPLHVVYEAAATHAIKRAGPEERSRLEKVLRRPLSRDDHESYAAWLDEAGFAERATSWRQAASTALGDKVPA